MAIGSKWSLFSDYAKAAANQTKIDFLPILIPFFRMLWDFLKISLHLIHSH